MQDQQREESVRKLASEVHRLDVTQRIETFTYYSSHRNDLHVLSTHGVNKVTDTGWLCESV